MIDTEANKEMGKDRKSGIEIIRILAEALTEEEQQLYNLSEITGLDHGTIERYLKIIQEVQTLFVAKEIHYKEQQIGKKTYKSGWVVQK